MSLCYNHNRETKAKNVNGEWDFYDEKRRTQKKNERGRCRKSDLTSSPRERWNFLCQTKQQNSLDGCVNRWIDWSQLYTISVTTTEREQKKASNASVSLTTDAFHTIFISTQNLYLCVDMSLDLHFTRLVSHIDNSLPTSFYFGDFPFGVSGTSLSAYIFPIFCFACFPKHIVLPSLNVSKLLQCMHNM